LNKTNLLYFFKMFSTDHTYSLVVLNKTNLPINTLENYAMQTQETSFSSLKTIALT